MFSINPELKEVIKTIASLFIWLCCIVTMIFVMAQKPDFFYVFSMLVVLASALYGTWNLIKNNKIF